MGLSKSHAAIEHQGVEGGPAGVLGQGIACGTRQAVAFTLDEVVECVGITQLRVDAHLLDTRQHKGVGQFAPAVTVQVDRHVLRTVHRRRMPHRRDAGGQRRLRDARVHNNTIL